MDDIVSETVDTAGVIVIDHGSAMTKVGFAGEATPRSIFDTGIMKNTDTAAVQVNKMGRARTSLHYPIEHGNIEDWDGMQQIWSEVYSNLNLATAGHHVLLIEPPLNPPDQREKMAKIMFEKFDSSAICVANSAVLSLYSTGRATGVVLESGDGVTHAVPIYMGHALPHATTRVKLAGGELTKYLKKILNEGAYRSKDNAAERKVIRDVKEKLCYVADDLELEMSKSSKTQEKSFELPDGNVITVGNERFRCPEALFQPTLIGVDPPAVQEATNNSIIKCDPDLHEELFANIVLAGGNTMFPGFPDRMKKEVAALAPSNMQVNIITPPERKNSAWEGGAILASCPSFQVMCITKQEYNECGPSVVRRKCF